MSPAIQVPEVTQESLGRQDGREDRLEMTIHGEHVTSEHSLNAQDRAQARGVGEMEDRSFQQKSAQATPNLLWEK